jgi:hypothetical protein
MGGGRGRRLSRHDPGPEDQACHRQRLLANDAIVR